MLYSNRVTDRAGQRGFGGLGIVQAKNLIASPAATGTELDLATAENELDFTSRITLRHNFRDRHEWEGYLAPMELIEFDPARLVPEPIDFGGVTFVPTPDSQFESRYNFLELRLVYRYELFRSENWSFKVGGGLQYANTSLEVTQFNGNPKDNDIIDFAVADPTDVNAVLSGRLDYRFNPRWSIKYEIDGYSSGNDSYLNTALSLIWQAAPGWDLGLGARLIRQISATLRSETNWKSAILYFG
jgi:hypothetical protein